MDYGDHVDAVERQIDGLVHALGAGPLGAPVPTCPEWTVADLADHVGGFCGFWAHVLCEGTGRPKTPFTERPEEGDAAGWFATVGGHLVDELRATPPDQEVWTWVPNRRDARFVARRSAHELSVHRIDAEAARGTVSPIDGALAVDGIEEIFMMVEAWRALGREVSSGGGETLHLHATDRPAEWLIEMTSGGLRVRREHAKGDLALRGAVSDLELTLYDRPPVGAVERFGDETVLAAWYRSFRFG